MSGKYGLSETVVGELRGVFRACPKVKAVLIFGSRAKGNYAPGSDIDLAVTGDGLTEDDLVALSLRIDDLELLYEVDLVDYGKCKGTPVGAHIDRVGLPFYRAGD